MKIFTVEEKGTVISMVAIGKKLDAIEFIVAWTNCDKFRSRICEKYVVHTKDYKRENGISYIPVYMVPFL